MGHGDVFSGAAFKTALSAILALVLILAAAGTASVLFVRAAMRHELETIVETEIRLLQGIYATDGRAELLETIGLLARSHLSGTNAVGLFRADGSRVAGDLLAAPAGSGWGEVAQPRSAGGTVGYWARSVPVGDEFLAVGQSMALMLATTRTLVTALAAASVVIAATVLAVGYVSSRRVFGKLTAIARGLEAVSSGDVGHRLAVGRENDQVDRIARQINEQLETLARVTEDTRNTITMIAHELRTPLNRTYLAIQEAAGESEPEMALAEAQRELEGVRDTFDTIMSIARARSAGDIRTPLALGPLVREIAETFDAVAADAGMTVVVEAEEAPPIGGDRRMLAQLLVNLVENAIRHCPAGTTIRIVLRPEPDAVLLSVEDDGPGISEAFREQVLQPFVQIGCSDDGLGLGLALVRAIAERHGARLLLLDAAPGLRVVLRFPPLAVGPGPEARSGPGPAGLNLSRM